MEQIGNDINLVSTRVSFVNLISTIFPFYEGLLYVRWGGGGWDKGHMWSVKTKKVVVLVTSFIVPGSSPILGSLNLSQCALCPFFRREPLTTKSVSLHILTSRHFV